MHAKIDSDFEMNFLFLEKPGYIIRCGNYWILICFLILFGSILFIPYSQVLEGEVLISGQEPPAQVQAGSSGKIANIFFSPGDNVEPDDVLAVIASPASYSDVQYLKGQLTYQHQIPDLETLVRIFPRELMLGPELQVQYHNAIEAFQSQILKKAFDEEEHSGLHNIKKEKNKEEQLKMKIKQIKIGEEKLRLGELNFIRNQDLFNKGVISRLDLENVEKEYLREKESLQNHYNELQILEFQSSEILNQSRLMRNSEIKEGKTYETEAWSAEKELRNAIAIWEEKYLLRSPIRGTLYFLDVWGPNQLVSRGDVIFKISSAQNKSFVGKSSFKAPIPGEIEPGTRALIKLDSHPLSEWGVIEGTVSSASMVSDGTENSRQIVYFHIPKMSTSSGRRIPFEQEMIGEVKVILEKSTMFSRIFNFLKDKNEM